MSNKASDKLASSSTVLIPKVLEVDSTSEVTEEQSHTEVLKLDSGIADFDVHDQEIICAEVSPQCFAGTRSVTDVDDADAVDQSQTGKCNVTDFNIPERESQTLEICKCPETYGTMVVGKAPPLVDGKCFEYDSISFTSQNQFEGNSCVAESVHRRIREYSNISETSVSWDHLVLCTGHQPVVGSGSFGVVVRAKYAFDRNTSQTVDVAVKIMTKKFLNNVIGYRSIRDLAWSEANTMYRAGVLVQQSDSVVKLYGVVEGPLPPTWQTGLRINNGNDTVIGIVMKYEAGGSLESLLHGGSKRDLDMMEKVRIMRGVALGLSELHSLPEGDYIVHGDIKPANVLLGGETPCAVKLADFGVSKVKASLRNTCQVTASLDFTSAKRGTPVYSAPELLPSPTNMQVCAPSRTSDMYAFAVLAWEVLTGERPFKDITTDMALCVYVHGGGRPDLTKLPAHTPPSIVEMIRAGFEHERRNRMNADECFVLLEHAYLCLSSSHFDIFFSHPWKDKSFLKHVFALLSAAGYRVWYDVLEMKWDLDKSMNEGVKNSSVVMACVNGDYQRSVNCMKELQMADAIDNPKKPVVSLVTERGPKDWASDELRSLCSFETNMYCDISDVAQAGSTAWENPSADMLSDLQESMQPMLRILDELGIAKSLWSA
jgi:serine/threonine protein kinase/uncharacterized protein YsxB (DUF464 family)